MSQQEIQAYANAAKDKNIVDAHTDRLRIIQLLYLNVCVLHTNVCVTVIARGRVIEKTSGFLARFSIFTRRQSASCAVDIIT